MIDPLEDNGTGTSMNQLALYQYCRSICYIKINNFTDKQSKSKKSQSNLNTFTYGQTIIFPTIPMSKEKLIL